MKRVPKLNFNPFGQVLLLSPFATSVVVTIVSVLLCSLLSFGRLPGMSIAGIGPNWLLVWVVIWSLKRSPWMGAAAGLVLGMIQDGLTTPEPTHVLPLVIVGVLTARLQKERFVQEDFITVAIVVFAMAMIGETIMAIQFGFIKDGPSLAEIWSYHPKIALSSAILSSLWAPVLYWPLNKIWQWAINAEYSRSNRIKPMFGRLR
ncbi:rod shape-determining protein MreD [filamentous cyanobacterium LEGE 11480]|uniref:Rod shape-determining protein MreD n=1 Tax=Romeriopsis navalis LEGE 11480 TaxID=2777977 RepID=A0A928VRC5_9CYAN|nr:rod shape-determining protein MreD [Romeriopsis navalis]MBE9030699.1 rod shape-determining protein MreD [Romeriopsis navalis LEGE 11480]